MKGVRFYADIPGTEVDPKTYRCEYTSLPRTTTVADFAALTRRRPRLHFNCIAVLLGDEHRRSDGAQEALVAATTEPNGGTHFSNVSWDYLRSCRRIPASLAAKLHPALYERCVE